MLEKKITFDSFIRGTLIVAVIVAIILLVKRLSSVLLPFFIAWLLAYMLYPLVRFLQYKCKLRNRVFSIAVALILVLAGLTGIMFLVVPPIIDEVTKLSEYIAPLAHQYLGESGIVDSIDKFIKQFVNENSIVKLIQQNNVMDALQAGLSQVWSLIAQTLGFIVGIFTVFVVFLYMFFILLDYEKLSAGFIHLIPSEQRPFATQLIGDVEKGMIPVGSGFRAFYRFTESGSLSPADRFHPHHRPCLDEEHRNGSELLDYPAYGFSCFCRSTSYSGSLSHASHHGTCNGT